MTNEKPYKETIYTENDKRFYRCFIVPKELQYSKDVEYLLCEIPNFRKTLKMDIHTLWYLFEITQEEYKQRKLDINKTAFTTLMDANLDEDLEITDKYTDSMIDEIIKKRTLKYNPIKND